MDVLARLYAERLSQRLGASFIVANRPGAGGIIVGQAVAAAAPDGYTLAVANLGHAILGALNKNLPFDPAKDFASIAMIGEHPEALAVIISRAGRAHAERIRGPRGRQVPARSITAPRGLATATGIFRLPISPIRPASKWCIFRTNPARKGLPTCSPVVWRQCSRPRLTPLSLLRDCKIAGALPVVTPHPCVSRSKCPSARSANIDYEYSTWYGFRCAGKDPEISH